MGLHSQRRLAAAAAAATAKLLLLLLLLLQDPPVPAVYEVTLCLQPEGPTAKVVGWSKVRGSSKGLCWRGEEGRRGECGEESVGWGRGRDEWYESPPLPHTHTGRGQQPRFLAGGR